MRGVKLRHPPLVYGYSLCILLAAHVQAHCAHGRQTWTPADPTHELLATRLPICSRYVLLVDWARAANLKISVARWKCDKPDCLRSVEYDGSADSLFCLRRRNKHRRWMIFTRALLDKLFAFIITARTTYTAATRYLSNDIRCFQLRRQDVVKLGTAMLRIFRIPPETGRCPICGPNPQFIVIDGQALGCTDPDDAQPTRLDEECPVLDVPATKLCIIENAGLRAAINKVLRGSTALTDTQAELLRKWNQDMAVSGRRSAEGAAAYLFFLMFPLNDSPSLDKKSAASQGQGSTGLVESDALAAGVDSKRPRGVKRKPGSADRTLESALRQGADGELTLGGPGAPVVAAPTTWRDRTGICAPNFGSFPRDDDGAWLAIIPFFQAMLAETVSGMFHGHDEKAVRLAANTFRIMPVGMWRKVTKALDGVGFVASFVGRMAAQLDKNQRFRVALGRLLLAAVDMETVIDHSFDKIARSKESLQRGWVNASYCEQWGGTPSPADYKRWRALRHGGEEPDVDDPFVSYEYFAGLARVRPGIKDSEAAKRRVGYRGKDRHAADMEGDADSCNKAFSIKCGLTQGVFNVVCPHVVTLGFRCLFRAESVGEALSIVLERFPQLPKVIFYDVACKLDKNALRRVRPILRSHGFRCILDRPHSITHSCSPIYMPDESLGSTAVVATQAAEVSHSIAVVNRTSLAFMAPATYMVHKMAQVAMMNVRKIHRLLQVNSGAENDHVPLSPFYHAQLSRTCQRGSVCSCQMDVGVSGPPVSDDNSVSSSSAMDLATDGLADLGTGLVETGADSDGGDQATEARHVPKGDARDGRHVKLASGVPQVATGLRGVSFPKDRQLLRPLSTAPLLPSETSIVDSITHDRLPAEIARAVNKSKSVLTVNDFVNLRPMRWLNDEAMNSFVALVNHRDGLLRASFNRVGSSHDEDADDDGMSEGPSPPRAYMFSTYFFSRMVERGGVYDYHGVRNWGRKGNLHLGAVDVILVPIFIDGCHWVLVVINVSSRSFLFYDPMFSATHADYVPALRQWLQDEADQRLGADDVVEWDIPAWQVLTDSSLPRQRDGSSCGVFVLAVADCLATGTPATFTQEDVPVLRQRLALSLYRDDLTVGHLLEGGEE